MKRSRDTESGMTLVELLVAGLVTAIVVGVIAAAFIVGLRTTGSTGERLAFSHDRQLVTIHLPSDVFNAGGGNQDIVSDPANNECSGQPNLVRIRWREIIGTSSTTFFAAYRIESNDSEWQLVRYFCRKQGSGAVVPEGTTVVARNLSGASAGQAQIDLAKRTVALRLEDTTGRFFTVTGQGRTSTTLQPPIDASIAMTDNPDPAARGGAIAYVIGVQNVGAQDTTGPVTMKDVVPASLNIVNVAGGDWTCNTSGQTVTCTIPSIAAGTPDPEPITIATTVRADAPATVTNTATVETAGDADPGNNETSATTAITVPTPPVPTPCTVLSAPAPNAVPNPAQLTSGGRLTTDVLVTFRTSGSCSNLKVQYRPGNEGSTAFLADATASGDTWTATLPRNAPGSAQWTVGAKPVTMTTSAGAALPGPSSLTLTVNS